MEIGQIVAGRFAIERRAGSGGMGEVWQARDRQTGERVALKVLKVGREEHGERFAREASVLSEVRHPGIVRHVAHGVTPEGLPYLAMEWLEGETLGSRIARQGLSVHESIRLGLAVAEALSVLHARGIVHRDLKPGNLVLVRSDVTSVKILDFGIARFVGPDRHLTRPGMLMGTPGFMAPEQARGEAEIDARADVFALGCVLYRCLTGRAAFAGSDPLAILLKVMLEEAPRPSKINPEVPAALDDLVVRMLAKSPEDRPRDARAVADLLRAMPDADVERARRQSTIPPPPAITTAERRVMCLVLARFTEPGAIRSSREAGSTETPTIPVILGARLRALRQAAEKYQGLLDILADGSVVVVLASAGAATDLAARAARCALAMREELSDTPMIVATGRGVLEASVPVGEVIDRAVKMLDAADGRTGSAIRLDDATAGLLDDRFDVRGDAGGLYLVGERSPTSPARTLLGKPTQAVGRDREIASLEAIWDECVSEPVARAVLVTGPAGVGKSRVRYELLERLRKRGDTGAVWIARGDPMGAGSPLGLIAIALRRALGLFDGEALEVRQHKLAARLSRLFSGEELRRQIEFLGELTGVPAPGEGSDELRAARQDAILMGDQMRQAWEEFVAAECRTRPVLLVLEDLHWGDLATVRFVDHALRRMREQPFMVLALGRPELHQLFPRLWEDRGLLEMRLLELTRKASERLVRQVLGDEIDPATVAQIVERSGGNAFYLEELIRAVALGQGTTLPDSVLAMVQARLEALDPAARRVMRAASVFGESFWEEGVLELCGGQDSRYELPALLSALTQQEVVAQRATSRFPKTTEYVFRHALVREVAYSMLTDTDRALGHRLAGLWLEQAGEADPLVLAEHFERGGESERAIAWYRRSAEHALEGSDLEATIARAERGIECGATGEMFGVLRLLQAEACVWRGDLRGAEAYGTAALEKLPRGSPLWFRLAGGGVLLSAQIGLYDRLALLVSVLREEPPREQGGSAQALAWAILVWLLVFLGQRELAETFLERLDRLDERLGEKDPVANGWVETGRFYWSKFAEGDLLGALEHARASEKSFARTGDMRTTGMARLHHAWALLELGGYAEAAKVIREVLAAGERRGMGVHTTHAKRFLAPALAGERALAEAYKLAVEAKHDLSNNRMTGGVAKKELARVLVMRGELDGAIAEARAAIEELSLLVYHRAHAEAILAQALLERGRAAEAVAVAKSSIDSGNVADGEALARLVYAEALEATGDVEAGRKALAKARARLLERAAKISEPAWRQRFLERVPEHAKTLRLAAERLDGAEVPA